MKRIILCLALPFCGSCARDFLSDSTPPSPSPQPPRVISVSSHEALYNVQRDHYNILCSFVYLDKSKKQYVLPLTEDDAIRLGVTSQEYSAGLELVSRLNKHINHLKPL